MSDEIQPRQELRLRVVKKDGAESHFTVTARLDTPVEVVYFKNGGILQTVLRQLLASGR